MVVSHGWLTVSSARICDGLAGMVEPSAERGADQRYAGWLDEPSLDFHCSHRAPVAGSTNGDGSTDPPRAV